MTPRQQYQMARDAWFAYLYENYGLLWSYKDALEARDTATGRLLFERYETATKALIV